MYVIGGIGLAVFVGLFLLSAKEETDEKGISRLFSKAAVFLYLQSGAAGVSFFARREVVLDLKRLNPYGNVRQLCREYYVDKLSKCQMIIMVGILVGLMVEKWADAEGMLFGVGGMVVAVLIYFLFDRDLHARVEKKRYQMKCAYPDIVHKLALYMGAGLTTRGALLKISEEQEDLKKGMSKVSPAYVELQYACRELASGMSEAVVYERLGKRMGTQEYIRLCTLLSQNLRRGNGAILERLREEVMKASVERIHRGRRLGEEAVTKLLLPMVMMLLVVMLMIMIPAFSTVAI